jgi:branched-chain amino acid transport system permease protein
MMPIPRALSGSTRAWSEPLRPRSPIALNAYSSDFRRAGVYWMTLASMVIVVGSLFVLLRSRIGSSIQAIRDNEQAAGSLGVRVLATKRLIFLLAAAGSGLAGALWLSSFLTFQPKTFFSVQWTAYMMFMVLVGGLGTFEGPILGAILFFGIEALFGAAGVWYLVGLGATALVFSLFVPNGIWGLVQENYAVNLLPTGYRLKTLTATLQRDNQAPASRPVPVSPGTHDERPTDINQ